jgi:hypothetical protein
VPPTDLKQCSWVQHARSRAMHGFSHHPYCFMPQAASVKTMACMAITQAFLIQHQPVTKCCRQFLLGYDLSCGCGCWLWGECTQCLCESAASCLTARYRPQAPRLFVAFKVSARMTSSWNMLLTGMKGFCLGKLCMGQHGCQCSLLCVMVGLQQLGRAQAQQVGCCTTSCA